jgi:hypothetical protein
LIEWGVGDRDGAGLIGRERGSAGRGAEEGPLAEDAADGDRRCSVVGEGKCLSGRLAGGDLSEVDEATQAAGGDEIA